MEFKTTDGMTIYSANVIKTDVKFKGKGTLRDIDYAKAKIDKDRKWYTIAKSSQKDFVEFALRLQSNFMSELGIGFTSFTGNVQIGTDNIRESEIISQEPTKTKTDPLIYVSTF